MKTCFALLACGVVSFMLAACGGGNDAATKTVVSKVESGNNAHSVAFDPATHQLYMPYSSAAPPGGCQTCADFPSGGVLVYTIRSWRLPEPRAIRPESLGRTIATGGAAPRPAG